MILGHGDDLYGHQKIKANFSSNVYRHAQLIDLKNHLSQSLDLISSYPEPNAASLTQVLAEHYAVCPNNIHVTNGATEAIYLIAQAFRGKKSVVLSPVFSEYADACSIHEHEVQHIFQLEDFVACDLFWLCNPNNPTGEVYPKAQLTALFNAHPKTIFIVDASYAHFIAEALCSAKTALEYPNVIMLHSMTKHFAIPGLRLGFMSGEAELLTHIKYYAMPWSVNQLAIEAGKYLIQHHKKFALALEPLLMETEKLQTALAKIDFLQVYPTKTHFFLVQLWDNKGTAAALKAFLIKEGLLIRDAANFIGLSPQHFRVATQTPYENRLLIEAIKKW